MAIETGDLFPRSSGAASLGVEQIGVCGFTTDIRPFCHVHANSGVFHGPFGSSGVLRYNSGRLQKSDNGGLDFLALVGNLDEAYQGGNRINQNATAAGPKSAAANFFVDFEPVVVRQVTPGGGSTLPGIHQELTAASIVASGFTLTPNLQSTFSYTAIGPGFVTLSGSGTVAAPERAGRLSFGAENNVVFGPTAFMVASGLFIVLAEGGTLWAQSGPGDITFLNQGGVGTTGLGGQIQLQPFAASGQLEYRFGPYEAWHVSPSHTASFFPLAHSGQVEQMILEGVTQQKAYLGGNEIRPPRKGTSYQGVVVYEPPAPFGNTVGWDDDQNPYVGHTTYGIAVSGSPIAGQPSQAALARLTANFLHIRPSGVTATGRGLFVGFRGGADTDALIDASGQLSVVTTGNMVYFIGGQKQEIIAGSHQFTIDSFATWLVGSAWDLSAQRADIATSDRIDMRPWNGSGRLDYRFGPYEAWHTTVGAGNTDLVPIPHSGHVLQMILENAGGGGSLQNAYNNGHTINTTVAAGGPVHITGSDTYGLRLDINEADGTPQPHMIVSGIIRTNLGAAALLPGALWMQGHTAGWVAQYGGATAPTTRAQSSAQSLGIDTLFYNTGGSGVVAVRTSSGVAQFFNVGGGGAVDEIGKIVPLSLQTTPSTFYHVTSTSGVQIFVPGMYKIHYVSVLEKNLGNLAQQVNSELRIRDKWGQEFKILGSESSAIIRDSNTLNLNTCNGQAITDLSPGDALVIYVTHQGAVPADNRVVIPARLSNLIVEWIGPLSGGKITQQKL